MTAEGEQGKILYEIFLVAAAVVFVVVAAIIGWSIVRHRERGDGRDAPRRSENVGVELLWWAIPTVLVIVLFILAARVLGSADEEGDAAGHRVISTAVPGQWPVGPGAGGPGAVGLGGVERRIGGSA